MKTLLIILTVFLILPAAGETRVSFINTDTICRDTIEDEEHSEPDLQSIIMRDENLRKQGLDFCAWGNEPFWNLEIDTEGNSKFSLHGKIDYLFETPVPETDNALQTVTYKSKDGKIEIHLKKEQCSDVMSGEKNPFSAEINLRNSVYKGCGKYLVFNKNPLLKSDIGRLNDIWALEKYMGEPVDISITRKGAPLLEIHLNEGRIIGNNGCNEFSGLVDADDTEIKFHKIISTKMFCPESMESQFMDALRKVNRWELSGMRLILYFNNEIYLTFKKID